MTNHRSFEVFNVSNPAGVLTAPDGTILLSYRGSIAHGMKVPHEDHNCIDDIDLMGVVIGGPEHYFGLQEWGSRGTKEVKQGQYDVVYYEIRKMVSLLLQGNPNVLSMLWTGRDHQLHSSYEAHRLIAARRLFCGRHAYNAFAGYAHAQLEKMETRDPVELREYLAVTAELKRRGAHPNHKGEVFDIPEPATGIERDVVAWGLDRLIARLAHFQKKGDNIGYMGDKRKRLVLEHGFDRKNAAHLIRLLRMCREFMDTGDLIVLRPDAEELLDIKTGRKGGWTLERVKHYATELFEDCRKARDLSPLPLEPDRQAVERLLIAILRENLTCAVAPTALTPSEER